ncbi:MAG: hypothetical protein QOF37_779 [Thermoleophilaceae bacterium]|jgi:hypothetical protein|nr:hypothetical protein [Thermoleophilaceae bacterium]
MEVLGDVDRYPSWASLIAEAETIEPGLVRLHAQALGIGFEMDCALELSADTAVMRRLPYDSDDEELYVATWTLRPGEVELHVEAAIDVVGAAGLIRGRIERKLVDELVEDFARAV